MNENILHEVPLIKTVENFLDPDMCNNIIRLSQSHLMPAKVVGQDGASISDSTIRSSEVVSRQDNLITIEQEIFKKVSILTGFSTDQFEPLTVHRYAIGQEFKLHQDYFIEYRDPEAQKNHEERCKKGGNRIATVLLYLNDVEAGGKTWFPWVNELVEPVQGKLIQFNYSYDDWLPNIQTQHHGLPVESGEKWIATIWIRERSIKSESHNYKKFVGESFINENLVDANFQLQVGPQTDRMLLNLALPANDNPENAIIVGFTGGMDSSLLLYLVGLLNTHLLIPYQIVPVMMKNHSINILEEEQRARLILNWIRADLNSTKIRNLQVITSDLKTASDSIYEVMTNCMEKIPGYPHYKPVAVFNGVNRLPPDEGESWQNLNWRRKKVNKPYWKTPFYHLKKYHLLDAILQLELDPILVLMGKCGMRHKTLDEPCKYFACNERRWAFRKLGINSLGNKYLTYRS